MTASSLPVTSVEYTISQPMVTLDAIAPFTIVPSNCAIVYSFSVVEATSMVTLDASTRKFSIFEASSLSSTLKVSPYAKDYTVTFKGSSSSAFTGATYALSQTLSFVLKVKNPCVDPAYNTITTPTSSQISYTISQAAVQVNYATGFAVTNSLCGSITYSVSGLSAAITNDAAASTLSIFSDDNNIGGTNAEVLVSSSLTEYPSVKGTDLKVTVSFTKKVTAAASVPQIHLGPEFEKPLVTSQSVNLSKSVVEQSINLGRLVDPEGKPFTVSLTNPTDVSFVTATLSATNEWILNVKYDAAKNAVVQNRAPSFSAKVTQTKADGSLYTKTFIVNLELAGLPEPVAKEE